MSVSRRLEALQNDYDYVCVRKYARPSLVHVLEEVRRTRPDDTWLTQFELKTSGRGKEVQRDLYLRGESGNAGKLIALLEDTKLVEQAAPRSPTTKIQGASGEIFDVGARLRTLTLPAPERLALGAMPVSSLPVVAAPSVAAPTPAPAPTAPVVPVAAAAAPQPVAGASVPLAPMRAAPSETISPTTAAGFGPFPEGYVPPPSALPQDAAPRPARQGPPALPPAAPGVAPAAPGVAPAAPRVAAPT